MSTNEPEEPRYFCSAAEQILPRPKIRLFSMLRKLLSGEMEDQSRWYHFRLRKSAKRKLVTNQ